MGLSRDGLVTEYDTMLTNWVLAGVDAEGNAYTEISNGATIEPRITN